MNRKQKIAYVRDELQRFAALERRASSETEWIMFKLSCSQTEAERLIAAAAKPADKAGQ